MRPRLIGLLFLLLCSHFMGATVLASTPPITLEEVLEGTRQHYPALRQKERVAEIDQALQKAIWYAYLPQISLLGNGSYQSEVTYLDLQMPEVEVMPGMPPVQVPPIDFPKLPHLQYNAYLQATQLIWDGGRTKATQKVIGADHSSEIAQLGVELHQVEEQVITLYFSLLMLQAQQEMQQALLEEINRQVERSEVAYQSGLASEQDLDEMALQRVAAEGQLEQLGISEKHLRKSLSILSGQSGILEQPIITPLPKTTEEETPIGQGRRLAPNREEHRLLDTARWKAEATLQDFIAEGMPTLALYARGGYGRPGLNMMDPKGRPFYMVGLTLKWDFGRLYGVPAQRVRERQSKEIIELKREALEQKIEGQVQKLRGEMEQYDALLNQDAQLIEIRSRILERAKVQEAEGFISKIDYMSRLTAYIHAKQLAEVHQIQKLLAQYRLQHQLGK